MPVIAMFCEKCGKELPEDSRFCLDCGQPVIPEEPNRTKETKKKSYAKFWLLGIASVLFVVGVLTAVFFADIAAWVERQVLSPEMLLKKAIASVAQDAGFGEAGGGISAEIPRRYKMGLYLDEDIQKLLSMMTEGDSTWITDIRLQLVAGQEDGLGRSQLSLVTDETPIVSLDVIQNAENAWIGFPELNERYLEVSKLDLGQANIPEDMQVTQNEMAKMIRPYFNILFDSIHRVTKKNTSLTVGNLQQNVLQLTAQITGEDMREAFSKMAERLEDDETARNLLNNLAQEDIHAELVRNLEIAAANIELELQLIVYLDKYNKPVGFAVKDGEGESVLCYAKVAADGKFASRLNWQDIVLSGNGTTSGGKDTGVCCLKVDGNTVLTYELKDFCVNKNGFTGSLFFPLDGILPESSGLPDAQMGLELCQETVDGAQVLSLGFVVEEKMLAGMLLSSEKINDFSVEIPNAIVPVNETDKVEKWIEGIHWDSIAQRLTAAGVPVAALESLIG